MSLCESHWLFSLFHKQCTGKYKRIITDLFGGNHNEDFLDLSHFFARHTTGSPSPNVHLSFDPCLNLRSRLGHPSYLFISRSDKFSPSPLPSHHSLPKTVLRVFPLYSMHFVSSSVIPQTWNKIRIILRQSPKIRFPILLDFSIELDETPFDWEFRVTPSSL